MRRDLHSIFSNTMIIIRRQVLEATNGSTTGTKFRPKPLSSPYDTRVQLRSRLIRAVIVGYSAENRIRAVDSLHNFRSLYIRN